MISVVIPLYNKEKSVLQTLNSISSQTYHNFEVVIVNDGSTDHSDLVVEKWLSTQRTNMSVKLIHQDNAGVSSARNRGIRESIGEYVAFLDADDLWHSSYLEEMARLIDDYPDMGLYSTGYSTITQNYVPTIGKDGSWYRGVVSSLWNNNLSVWTGCVCCCRDLLIKLGGFDTRMTHGEDLDMWWRLILAKGHACFDKPLAYYIQDSENRAMNRPIPLEKHIPYYMDMYAEARRNNADFRRYFDTQMVYRLYPYLFDSHYCAEAKRLAKLIDYTQLKFSMKFRMQHPFIYHAYLKMKSLV